MNTATNHTTRCFSAREREIIKAVAEAIIPAGERIPSGGCDATVDRFEALLNNIDPRSIAGISAALWTLETGAVARYLQPFSRLSSDRRAAFINSWHHGSTATRLVIKLLSSPLKLAHFDDPELFEALGFPYHPKKAKPEKARWRQQILTPADLGDESELEADVVVVGTGAGGAVVAKELAQRGHAVLMLEEGRFWDRVDFSTRSRVELNTSMFAERGALATVGNAFIVLPVGKTVGGSTTVNSGTCFRAPDKVLEHWTRALGLSELNPDAMVPYFERVEKVLGVEDAGWPELGRVAEIIRDGCDALGYSHHPLARNAEGCDGQGLCVFGCPTDAKRSTNVSYVPLALKRGAMCVTSARVSRVLLEGGRAVGVEADLLDGPPGTIRVRAKHVVLACGSVYTPTLLLQNGLCNRWDQVGRHLTIHPAVGMGALFDDPVRGWEGIPQGYCVDEFRGDGILFEGAFVPMEFASMAFPMVGRDFTDLMDAFDRLAVFGFMISDKGRGRVRRGPGGRPIVTYYLHDDDVRRMQRGSKILGEIYLAAGARRIYTPIAGHEVIQDAAGLSRMSDAKLKGWDFDLSAYHPLGTCRMGTDPRTSVIDMDHESHEVPNLFIVDGSSVPSALGVNPQVTIMALATRFADRLHERLA